MCIDFQMFFWISLCLKSLIVSVWLPGGHKLNIYWMDIHSTQRIHFLTFPFVAPAGDPVKYLNILAYCLLESITVNITNKTLY